MVWTCGTLSARYMTGDTFINARVAVAMMIIAARNCSTKMLPCVSDMSSDERHQSSPRAVTSDTLCQSKQGRAANTMPPREADRRVGRNQKPIDARLKDFKKLYRKNCMSKICLATASRQCSCEREPSLLLRALISVVHVTHEFSHWTVSTSAA